MCERVKESERAVCIKAREKEREGGKEGERERQRQRGREKERGRRRGRGEGEGRGGGEKQTFSCTMACWGWYLKSFQELIHSFHLPVAEYFTVC